MSPADQLTVARALSVPVVVVLFAWPFTDHAYWATAVFCLAMTTDWFDGRLARRHGRTSPLGSLLDPIADKVLVLGMLVMLVGQHVVPAWMVAAIVVREVLITGLRQAAIERGIVIAARDLGKLKTWAQAIAAGARRIRGRRRVGHGRRVVVAARRGRPDVGVGARLRAQRAGALPAARLPRQPRPRGLAPVAEARPGAQVLAQLVEALLDLRPNRPVAVAAIAELVDGGRRGAAYALVEHDERKTAGRDAGLRLLLLPGRRRRLVLDSARAATMAARSSSLGSGLICKSIAKDSKVSPEAGRLG